MLEAPEFNRIEELFKSTVHQDGNKGPQTIKFDSLTSKTSSEKVFVKNRLNMAKKVLVKLANGRINNCRDVARGLLKQMKTQSGNSEQTVFSSIDQLRVIDLGEFVISFSARIDDSKRAPVGNDLAFLVEYGDEIKMVDYGDIAAFPGDSLIAKKDDGHKVAILRTGTPGLRIGFEFSRTARGDLNPYVGFSIIVDNKNKNSEIQ